MRFGYCNDTVQAMTARKDRKVARGRRLLTEVAFLSTAMLGLLLGGVASASNKSASPAGPYNPPTNIKASPDFLLSGHCRSTTSKTSRFVCPNPCVSSTLKWPEYTNSVSCTQYTLRAINAALKTEHVGPLVLPTNWYVLSVPQKLFVVADMERVIRGYPAYLGLNADLSTAARRAALQDRDPSPAAGFPVANNSAGYILMGGAWSNGFSVLAADYVWMYADGWAGSRAATSNVSCTSAHARGCWAHRDQLLGSDPGYNPGVGLACTTCEMGAAFAIVRGSASYVDTIEAPAHAPAAMIFTWAKELKFFPPNAWRGAKHVKKGV